jgi:hypothetical protein
LVSSQQTILAKHFLDTAYGLADTLLASRMRTDIKTSVTTGAASCRTCVFLPCCPPFSPLSHPMTALEPTSGQQQAPSGHLSRLRSGVFVQTRHGPRTKPNFSGQSAQSGANGAWTRKLAAGSGKKPDDGFYDAAHAESINLAHGCLLGK